MNIIGRLTRDAETRTLPDGTALTSFSLATDTGSKTSPSTMFLDCTAFGKTSDIVSQYAGTKGTQLACAGRLKQDNWEDKTTGAKRSKICMIVERVTLLNNRRDEANQTPSSYDGEQSQAAPVEHHNGFDGSREAPADAAVPF